MFIVDSTVEEGDGIGTKSMAGEAAAGFGRRVVRTVVMFLGVEMNEIRRPF